MSVVLCLGNHCKLRSKCKRYIVNYPKTVAQCMQVIDWSSYGGGCASTVKVETDYCCGDNSHDYPLYDPIQTDEEVMAAALSKLGIPTYNEDGTKRSMEAIVADLAKAQWVALMSWGDNRS